MTSGLLDGPHDFFAELGPAVADDKRGTGPGHRQGGRPADACPAAGHDADFVGQRCHVTA
jgi:hypothetical protein